MTEMAYANENQMTRSEDRTPVNEQPRWKRTPSAPPSGFDRTPQDAESGAARRAPDAAADAERAAEAPPIPIRRVWLVVALFVIIILAMIARMSYWAVASGPLPDPVPAADERIRSRVVDRNGLLLATDNFTWEAYARPQAIMKDAKDGAAGANRMISQIAQILGQPVETIQAGLAVTYSLTTLAKNVDATQREKIAALGQPSLVWTEDRRIRAYPLGQLGAHLIGFTDYQRDGLFGVEASYNNWLLGQKDLPPVRFNRRPQRNRSRSPKTGASTCRRRGATT